MKEILDEESKRALVLTLFEKRHSGDYDDFAYCDKDVVDELYPKTRIFIDTINELLKAE